jgi:hypothetical protein
VKIGEMPFGQGRRFLVAVAVIVSAFVSSHLVRAEESSPVFRWTTNDGHFFQGKFLGRLGTSIVVGRDGYEFRVSMAALSPASLELARGLVVRVPLGIRATGVPMAIPVTAPAPLVVRATPVAPVASFSFGPSILAFCRENLGKKIGNGQCGSLAAAALKNVGAPARGADWPGEGDYVWGDLVAWLKAGFSDSKGAKELAHVAAGDIIQFHNTRFSGFDHSDSGAYRMQAQHHTAVVESVDPARQAITVLHQNWNHQEMVRRQTLYLRGMTSGWLRFYRPTPAA